MWYASNIYSSYINISITYLLYCCCTLAPSWWSAQHYCVVAYHIVGEVYCIHLIYLYTVHHYTTNRSHSLLDCIVVSTTNLLNCSIILPICLKTCQLTRLYCSHMTTLRRQRMDLRGPLKGLHTYTLLRVSPS